MAISIGFKNPCFCDGPWLDIEPGNRPESRLDQEHEQGSIVNAVARCLFPLDQLAEIDVLGRPSPAHGTIGQPVHTGAVRGPSCPECRAELSEAACPGCGGPADLENMAGRCADCEAAS